MDTVNQSWSALPFPVEDSGRLPLGPEASPSDGTVVALGVVCDGRTPWDGSNGQLSFALNEYVELESGKCVVLCNERGVTVGVRGGASPDFTASELHELFSTALLPNEGEGSEKPLPYEWLAELAARHNVDVTPEELEALPYHFDFRPAVNALVRRD